jgi:hypothetical protein
MTNASRRLVFACLAVSGAALGSGCGSIKALIKPPAAIDSATGDSIPRFVDVQVANHNWADVIVYLNHGASRTRLGSVGTARASEFRFPASYAHGTSVTLLVTPIGSPARFESERFTVQPGQTVYWTIESSLARSSLMIR